MGKLRQQVRKIDGGRLVLAPVQKNAGMAFSLFRESVELSGRSDCVELDTN